MKKKKLNYEGKCRKNLSKKPKFADMINIYDIKCPIWAIVASTKVKLLWEDPRTSPIVFFFSSILLMPLYDSFLRHWYVRFGAGLLYMMIWLIHLNIIFSVTFKSEIHSFRMNSVNQCFKKQFAECMTWSKDL